MRPFDNESQFRVEQAHDIFEDLVTYLQDTTPLCDDPQARLMFETATEAVQRLAEVFSAYDTTTPHEKSA